MQLYLPFLRLETIPIGKREKSIGFQTEKNEKFQKLYFNAYCIREGVPEEQGESKPAGWEYSVLAGHGPLCDVISIFPPYSSFS